MNKFIQESNRIEGIVRDPTEQEEAEYERFMALDAVTLEDCERFVYVYQPNARLRSASGMDVRVGSYFPPKGGANILHGLLGLLTSLKDHSPFENHLKLETLHPFTDCNGRLGRMIWMWQMREEPLGFLHRFYYQSLNYSRR